MALLEVPREQALAISLRALRETLNYSQEAWAVLLGMSWRTVMRWEQGRAIPSEHSLIMLRCRLNHGGEALLWRERLATNELVWKLLTDVGLLELDAAG